MTLRVLLLVLVATLATPGASAAADDTPPPQQVRSVYTRLPAAPPDPLRVVVLLHGVGGNGELFAANFAEAADRNNWLIVAPTLGYGDWQDPQQVAREEPLLVEWLATYLDSLGGTLPIQSRVLLLGHSRGAQLAHRFALFYPDRVLGVAALSAGTYTLPRMLDFPFGMRYAGRAFRGPRGVQFLLGVGTDDTNPSEVPRAWDSYLGMTRVQRANTFNSAVHDAGARTVLVAFRGARHAMTPEMARSATTFLRGLDLADASPGAPEPVQPHPTARGRY